MRPFFGRREGVFFGVTKTLPVLDHGASNILVSSIASANLRIDGGMALT